MLALMISAFGQPAPAYRYFRLGNTANATSTPRPGFALMGGGTDLDEAFQWLCERAGGGDLLVLRATGKDDYNSYIQKLCHLNSVATIVIPDRAAAQDPFVAQAIGHASALFISGGDQANYINFWQETPVQTALNEAIKRGVPIGGTSAGLAVLGEYAYTAQGDKPDDPNLDGKLAMADPYGPRITINHNFLEIPILKGIITDTHFAKRDRMGRLLVFVARLNVQDGKPLAPEQAIRGIGIEEGTALLLDTNGQGKVVGKGAGYLVDPTPALNNAQFTDPFNKASVELESPFSLDYFDVYKVTPGGKFNLNEPLKGVNHYALSVHAGQIHTNQAGSAIY
jgi:cyanophycinase